VIDEAFARGDSLLHRRDPRVKLIAALCLVAIVALTDSFTAVLLGMARPEPRAVGKRLLATNSFTLFLLVTLPLTYGGAPLVVLGPLHFSSEGLRLAALITLKANTIVIALLALLATSTVVRLGHALEQLGFPRKICFLLLFSYRYIFVIHQEYHKLLRAAQLRCFVPSTSLHTYRTYGYLFGMTMVHSWNRSFRVHQAMLLRGFDGQLIPLYRQRIDRKDQLFLGILLLCCIGLAASPL
jgi:cobalt/nickel transport system permease protein